MRIPPGFEAVSGVSARGFARPEAVAWVEQALGRWGTLHRASRHESDVIEFTGRGTVRAVPAPDGEGRWVVRRYRRGGMLAPLLGDRYLRRGEPRPLRETRASEAARRSGIATPPVIAGVIYPAGAWYRADLVTRLVADATDLADHLFADRPDAPTPTPAERRALLERTGRIIGELARAGIHHPDLNARNVLVVRGGAELHLLDFDRARVGASPTPSAPMVARLLRSLRRLAAAAGAEVGAADRQALRDGARAATDATPPTPRR